MTPLRRQLSTTSPMCWALVVAGTISGPSPTPNASFSISRFDRVADTQLVAPVALWLTPTTITGFVGFDGESISEPSGTDNVYDPTANEIFWSWDFGETGYVPLVTPNTPLTHRDMNKAYVKRPCHVFWKPQASTTVTLYGYDTAGNWGTATYTFNDVDGDSPAIQDPDDYFAGADTIFFSKAGIYPDPADIPAGALTTTLESAVNSRIASRVDADGTTLVRVRFRRGETYTNIENIGNDRPCYIDSYGDPLADPPKHIRTSGDDGPFVPGAGITPGSNQIRIIDQDWEGGYDASTETGTRRGPVRAGILWAPNVLYHRFRVSGALQWLLHSSTTHSEFDRVVSDCDVTNWQNYGIAATGPVLARMAIIGSDLHQKSDALNGIAQGGGSSNAAAMGNRHGPIRTSGARTLNVACSAFFSRNGWSDYSSLGWTTVPPTVCQNAYRLGGSDTTERTYLGFDRSSFESGGSQIGSRDPGDVESLNFLSNVLIESCLFVPTSLQWGDASRGVISGLVGKGLCIRNTYFYIADRTYAHGNEFTILVRATWAGATDAAKPSVVAFFNNTTWIAGQPPGGDVARTFASVGTGHTTVYDQNNIYYAPNLSGPTHGPYGEAFEPLGTSALAGFAPRDIGTKWNFKPVGWASDSTSTITCEAGREIDDGIGKVTGVADDEWMAFDYPDYSGQCNGRGDALMAQVALDGWAAVMAARTTPYDQLSVFNYGDPNTGQKSFTSSFEFTDTKIRVQNQTGGTRTGSLWILLDLRDWLMDPIPTTASPSAIPAPIPGTGSAAILVTESGLFAQRDFFGSVRQGKTAGGQVAVTGKPVMQGAFVEIPA